MTGSTLGLPPDQCKKTAGDLTNYTGKRVHVTLPVAQQYILYLGKWHTGSAYKKIGFKKRLGWVSQDYAQNLLGKDQEMTCEALSQTRHEL